MKTQRSRPTRSIFVHRPKHRIKPGYLLYLLLIFLILGSGCSLSSLNFVEPTPTLPYPTPAPAVPLPETPIEFHVQLPPDTPTREPVYLTVLDEVTGLGLNAKRYEMQAEDDLNYAVTLRFPVGSIIKYRYARQSTYLAQEHTSAKRPVRYRLLQVEGPAVLYDVVSVWSDMAFTGSTGRVQGQASDSKTGEPIPNLLVAAGGVQTFTAADGSFLIEGLPPGTHNLVAYALDGSYRAFQQGAIVAAQSTTPAPLQLEVASMVNIVFTVILPQNTMPAVPVRMAGNLLQLGNTFADLSGGISTLASRMPTLSPLPDGRYSITIALPAGADVRYKYTLGDGFWNAEYSANGDFLLRRLIVPDESMIVEDTVTSWGSSSKGPVLFDLSVPESTPSTDIVSIQFNPYGWTEPLPMWLLGDHHWAYVLYSPLEIFERFGYRYCRNDQCGSADDAETVGNESFGRILEPQEGLQTIKEEVESWAGLNPDLAPASITESEIRIRDPQFIAGVEFQDYFKPSWIPRMPVALKQVQSMGANWLILPATWTYTRANPPVLEIASGSDPLWSDLQQILERAHAFGLNVALYPTPHFEQDAADWWSAAALDFPWWQTWFERYTDFVLHHADLAQQQNAQALILGGDWISPALPGGTFVSGQPSGVPADAEVRWRDLIREVRSHYTGILMWALPLPAGVDNPPPFFDAVDQIYLLWNAMPLSDEADASEAEMLTAAASYMDESLKAFQASQAKPVVIAAAYPSADGGITGCLPDPLAEIEGQCLDLNLLAQPATDDVPTSPLDLKEQERVYNALLTALNERDWIKGFVTRGYYPPAQIQDKSSSVHGKPAADILWYWYPRLTGEISP